MVRALRLRRALPRPSGAAPAAGAPAHARGRARRGAGLAAALLLAAGWAATFALEPWSDERVNDLFVYGTYADRFLAGDLPWRDVGFEYPLLAPLPLLAGAVAGTGAEEYRIAFAVAMLAAALAALAATGELARLTRGDRRVALGAFALLPLLAGAMVRTHFDLVPVALALAALATLLRERVGAAFALVACGALAKAFPLLVAPVALAWLAGRGEAEAARRGAAVLGAVLAAGAGLWLALSPEGMWESLTYQADRPVQVESVPATLVNVADGLGLASAPRPVSSHRSDGIEHDAAGPLAGACLAAMLALIAWLVTSAARRPGARALVLASLAAILAFAALGRVLSPQFLIWIAPLGALALAWRLHALAAAAGAATLLTLAEFPARYFDVVDREPLALWLVGARNAALLAALALAVAALRREPGRAAARSPSPAPSRPPRPAPR